MSRKHLKPLLGLLLLLATLAGCGEEATPVPVVIVVTPSQPEVVTVVVTPPPPQAEPATPTTQPPASTADIEIQEATFAHGLSEEMQPLDPGADFGPSETVYLSLRIKGRPKEGLVTARFYWGEAFIAEASADLADVNSGLIFSVGEDTFVGYTLTHEEAFPISQDYRAELFYKDQPLGTYPFHVVPPPEAIPSQVKQITLARGADENYEPVEPTTTFTFDETVYLVGRADLGVTTWLQADWYVAGQLDEAGTRSLSAEENLQDAAFAFSFLPEGGWPPGEHYAILIMNDQEVGRYPFTIISSEGAAPVDEVAFWDAFPLPNDAETVPVVEGYDLGFATSMPEPAIWDTYAAWLRGQGWQQQAPVEARSTLPHQVWRKDGAELLLEIQGLDEQGRTVVWLQLVTGD